MITRDLIDRQSVAWEQFIQSGVVEAEVVRPEIARSWQRCRERGLDPYAPKLLPKLSPREVAAVRETYRTFVETALPFMEFLRTAVKGSGFLLVLTDPEGIVIEVFGDPELVSLARDNNFVPGCSRTEEDVGTNAICLALAEGKPIQLTGPEHWNVRHHRWTCASAPVFSPAGALLGSVTLSGETTNVHLHTLGMVISAAEAILDRLRQLEASQDRSRLDALLSKLLTTISEAIVTIDGAGIVSSVNATAAKLLSVTAYDVVGKSVLKMFPGNPELINALNPAKGTCTYEVTSEGQRGRSHLALTPYLLQADGMVEGAILVLRERRDFLNDVREVAGYSAVFTFNDIVGSSAALARQVELARITAQQSSRVLITGETGTGKELFAQAIHNASPRRAGPFVAVNCAAIPRELLESELFGYKGGAFTGSRKGGQVGKLELADGGTIFLDEINQMPVDLQSKLLRVLQDSTITRLGDARPIRVDVRVIAASNEDLYEKSRAGEFRQDLYFRLSVVELCLPPLRERVEDIPLLAQVLLAKIASRMGREELPISPDAQLHLQRHLWPGNIRELENVLEMAAIMSEGAAIEPSHLGHRMKSARAGLPASPPPPQLRAPALPKINLPVRDAELALISAAMSEMQGNIAKVSRKLGISRSTIYRRMKEHQIVKAVQLEHMAHDAADVAVAL